MNSASYTFLTNSTIVMKSNSTTRLPIARGYDNLFRLTVISNNPAADAALSFTYAYNSANQRTAVTNADASRWLYGYDSLGQVTSGKKYFSDGVIVPGEQFQYSLDEIGNRKYAAEGGNEWGTNLRYENYSVNSLNQYTQRTVPGAVDVVGAVNSNSTVTVNLTPTSRHGEYFRSEYRINNSATAVYQGITNVGVLANGTNADIVTTGECEYDPFGEPVMLATATASLNDFWFSTKRRDRETGWHYYGYRYLGQSRWSSRDPI